MAETDKKSEAAGKAKTVKARLLLDCNLGKCNTVLEMTVEAAKQAELNGLVDTNPSAVAAAQAE